MYETRPERVFGPPMHTSLEIDDNLASAVSKAARDRQISFEEALNEVLAAGIHPDPPAATTYTTTLDSHLRPHELVGKLTAELR